MTAPRMRTLALLAALVLATLPLSACTIAPIDPVERAELETEARAILALVDREEPGFGERLRSAPAFAVFPDVGKGAAVLGLAYGRGVLYDKGRLVGYCDLTQGLLGVALGGQGFAEIVCLDTPDAVRRFKRGVYTLNANANVVVTVLGASTQSRYNKDVTLLILDETGLMLEASIGTQELRCELLDPGDVN